MTQERKKRTRVEKEINERDRNSDRSKYEDQYNKNTQKEDNSQEIKAEIRMSSAPPPPQKILVTPLATSIQILFKCPAKNWLEGGRGGYRIQDVFNNHEREREGRERERGRE